MFDLTDILKPKNIFKHEIQSQIKVLLDPQEEEAYTSHSMCLIDYNYNSHHHESKRNISFVLFSTSSLKRQYNVIQVDVIASKLKGEWKIHSVKDKIVINAPVGKFPRTLFSYLPFCVANSKNQRIIVVIYGRSLYLYNFDENCIIRYSTVICISIDISIMISLG